MDNEYLTTKELAGLLRIKERKVYDLAALQQIPCTRATGKLLFSRTAITQWLAQHSTGAESSAGQKQILFAGSHDPLLEWSIRESQCGIPVLFDGSVDGIDRVMSSQATVSGMHIYSPSSGRWNIDAVKQRVDETSTQVVLLHWLTRQRGLLMKPGLGLSGLEDIARAGKKTDVSMVVRQAGAGSQLLLQHLLVDTRIDIADLNIALTARSEADMALAIAEGRADCGLGLESLAGQHQLDFIPLVKESFDLLVDRRFWFESPMQKFIKFCNSEMFATKVQQSVGYQADNMLSVVFNS